MDYSTQENKDVEKALWGKYLRKRTTRNRNALVEFYIPWAKRAAKRFHLSYPFFELEDVEAQAMLIMVTHFKKFDTKKLKSASPKTWLWGTVYRRLIDWMRTTSWATRTAMKRIQAGEETLPQFLSLTNPLFPGEDKKTFGDILEDRKQPEIDKQLVDRDMMDTVLAVAPSRIKKLLILHYCFDMPLAHVAKRLPCNASSKVQNNREKGISLTRTAQLHSQWLEKMRLRLRKKGITERYVFSE